VSAASCHFSKEVSKLDPGSGNTWSTEKEIQCLLPSLHTVQMSSVPVSSLSVSRPEQQPWRQFACRLQLWDVGQVLLSQVSQALWTVYTEAESGNMLGAAIDTQQEIQTSHGLGNIFFSLYCFTVRHHKFWTYPYLSSDVSHFYVFIVSIIINQCLVVTELAHSALPIHQQRCRMLSRQPELGIQPKV